MKKPTKNPRDVNPLAKRIVDLSTSDEQPAPAETPAKNPHAVALGKLGGAKGGHARAARLTADARREIAQKAARARWKKTSE